MLDSYLEILEEGYYEIGFAFDGLADHNVWKRPADGLLSIGEIAGHVAYWQAVRLTGEGGHATQERESPTDIPVPNLDKCRVKSPLIDHRFSYYTTNLTTPPSEEHLSMTAKQVCDELLRVHRESVAYFKSINPGLESHPPGWPPRYTFHAFLTYMAFHVAYHTGQIYSARHLLGENAPDN